MYVVLYSPCSDTHERGLVDQILRVVRRPDLVLSRTPEDLARDMLRPSYEILAVVLHPGTHRELKKLEKFRNLLMDIQVILVCPDSKRETLSIGFKFYPRFLCSPPEDIPMIAPVLERMILIRRRRGRG